MTAGSPDDTGVYQQLVGVPDGECTGRSAALGDATFRRTSDKELAESLWLLDTLLTRAPVGFVFLDRDLRFVRINDRLAEMNGLPVAAHLGRTVAEVLPTLEATLREVTARILATGQPVLNHEFAGETAIAPAITRYWNESWYPVCNEQGEIIGFGAVVEEITARKQAEAAQRLTNERLELAVKCSQAVLWQQDLDLRFTWLHNAAPGIDGSNAVGKRDADLLERAEDAAVIEGLKREVIRSGAGLRQEFCPQIQGVGHCFELLMEPLRDAAGVITGITGAAIDITERKRAEAAQHETDRYYRALAEASFEIPYRMSGDWSTMLPLDGREMVASSDRPLTNWAWLDQNLPRDEHARVRQAISDAIARKSLFEIEHRVLRPDGSTGWVHSRAAPILDENEGLVAWFGVASDITARKHAVAARQESEDHLRFALQAAEAGKWSWNIRSGEITWSPENYVLYDLDPAQGPPRYEDWSSRLHPDDRDQVNEHVRAVVDGREAEFRKEFRVVSRQGTVRWLLGLGRVERDRDGQPLRLSGLNLDITQRKRAEAALRETERNYLALAEASADIPYRMSADWSTMLTLGGRGLFASSDRPLADWAWVDRYLPRDEHARVRQAISEAIAGKSLFELEHRVVLADGSTGWVRSRAAPILDENEGVVTWFGVASDITEHKRIELNLIEATAAAEKASRAKSEFLASMSHELRTPLNAILGFAQLMDSGPTPLTPAQKRGNDQVVAAGWYLLGLINEILDLAKIDAGKVVLSWESISLADVMLESQSLVEPLAQRRGITMRFSQFDIPYFVKGDRIRLKQILINLLSNAVKYNRPHGSVSVEYTLATPDSIRIGVRDTGAGLTPKQLAQLFEPFNRLGRNADVEGAGIGLVVAKRLVELMGGTIGAESSVGVESLFWIELALAPAPPAVVSEAERAMPVQPPTPQRAPRKTVLYVEDNAASLALVEELFTRHPDLRLLTATDGLLGIELARTFVPDVIMMDINMPGMNGIAAMQTLRADPPTAHIPVIAVSAFAMPAEIERALEAGFFSYLTKPINLKEFVAALEVAITFSQTKSAPQLPRPNKSRTRQQARRS